jgi:glutamate-1-semialdehyde 2,1-aminomutase
MSTADLRSDTAPADAQAAQDALFEIAEANLPGAGLGGYALPDDVRFIAKSGSGAYLDAVDGRRFIDYVGGAGANIVGHCHPAVVEAVRQQAGRGLHYFGTLNDTAVELSDKLVSLIPCAEKIAFATTGSEATFYALRMARAFTGKDKVLKFEGAYHGNHDYSSFSLFPTQPANYPVGTADSGGVPHVLQQMMLIAPYNNLDVVEAIVREHKADLAAIIVETVQRIMFAEPEFLQGLRRICNEHGIVLIFDEVVTGFRLALGGGQEWFGVKPDLASYGKIVGGGGPLSCVAGRADIIDVVNPARKGEPQYAYINGTLHGNPIAAAAGLATIELLEAPGFHDDLAARADRLKRRLQDVLDRHGVPAICAGSRSFWQILFMGSEPKTQVDIMNSDGAAMRRLDLELLKRGIYILPGVRRFVASVNSDDDFEATAEALDSACRAL